MKGRSNLFNLMAIQRLFVLLFLAFGNYGFVKPNEEASVKIEIAVNTDQGSRHGSVALVKEDGKWKALNAKNREASQRSGFSILDQFKPDIYIPQFGRIYQIR